MKVRVAIPALVLMGAVALVGCKKLPLTSSKPVPAGSVVLRFTRSVKGPVELIIDGARIPVKQASKEGSSLQIAGLAPGKHRFFLTSEHEAFSPDAGVWEVDAAKGIYEVVLCQNLESVLYGKPDSLPPAEGLPGVTATLVK
jgi:hypothetical protein